MKAGIGNNKEKQVPQDSVASWKIVAGTGNKQEQQAQLDSVVSRQVWPKPTPLALNATKQDNEGRERKQ